MHVATVMFDHCAGNCECHLGPYYPCSEPGGCGHLHREATADVGAVIEQVYGLCPACVMVVTDALAELPQDYVALRYAQYRGLTPAAGELVKATKDLPIPISLTFAVLADQIEVEVTAFAEPVAEKLHIDWDKATSPKSASRYGAPPRYIGPVILKKSANLLANSVHTLLSMPPWEYRLWGEEGWVEVEADGIEAALTMLALHQATRATLGLTRASVTMQAPCPWCKAQSLVRIAGRSHIQCQLCQSRFTDTEYEQLTIITLYGYPKPSKRSKKHLGSPLHNTTEGTVGRPTHREVG